MTFRTACTVVSPKAYPALKSRTLSTLSVATGKDETGRNADPARAVRRGGGGVRSFGLVISSTAKLRSAKAVPRSAMQIPGATLAGVFNMGGAAVANYVSILERAG